MLRFVTIDAGDYQGRGADYVNILFDSVRRNLPEGFEGEFWCFTDRANAVDRGAPIYHPHIHQFPLPRTGLTGWWNKLALFSPGLFEPGDRIIYLDLDTLITGPLDEIVRYDGEFCLLGDFMRQGGWQSAVMMWRAGFGKDIWDEFVWAGKPQTDPAGDQAWIERHVEHADVLQDVFPGSVVSYKMSRGIPPETASIVCFHGKPRPHEVVTGWVPEVWKVGGLTRAQLDTVCNTMKEELYSHVRQNLKFGFPELQAAALHDGHAVIIGGGPSINAKVEEIKWRQGLGQKVFALNGAALWCQQREIRVDYQVIVDARTASIAFVNPAHREPHVHLISSQCSPRLLTLLEAQDAEVVLWHSDAPGVETLLPDGTMRIGGGSTVGLSAMVIAAVLGFKFIHLYGYDSSVAEHNHHAYIQPVNDDDMVVDVLIDDGTKFRAAPWMVQQAQEFQPLCQQLIDHYGVEVITVAGEGLLPHMARHMATPAPTPAMVRANEVLSRLKPGEPVFGVEVGVFGGDMSAILLTRPDLSLVMVDPWAGDGEHMVNKADFHAKLTQEQQDGYFRLASERVAFAEGRAQIMRMTSFEASKLFLPESLDFVFIDADHAYESVKSDIAVWFEKLKPGGLLASHDYGNELPGFGVTQAIDEFVEVSGLSLEIGDNFTVFIRRPPKAGEEDDADRSTRSRTVQLRSGIGHPASPHFTG